MSSTGVTFDIQQQETYDRVHVFIRIAITIAMYFVGFIFGLIYLAVPIIAAIQISQKGRERYFAEAEQSIASWLRLLIGFVSYWDMLTDRLPNEDPKTYMRFDVEPQGDSSAGGVLLRIILAIPHAFVLGILGIVAFVLAIIAGIMVLVQESYPKGIFDFLRGYVRWYARMYAYLAGFTDQYPPFALDTGPEMGAGMAPSAVAPQSPPPSAPPPPAAPPAG